MKRGASSSSGRLRADGDGGRLSVSAEKKGLAAFPLFLVVTQCTVIGDERRPVRRGVWNRRGVGVALDTWKSEERSRATK